MSFSLLWTGMQGRKSRNTWSNRQIWPWSTEWSRAKTNRLLPRECTDHSKHPPPTTQEKTLSMDITRWSTPKSDWLYSLQPKMEKLCSDHELLIAKFRFKLKKVGKTTRPFRSDQLLSRVRLFATPWIAARQASRSITNSRSSLRLTSIESVMPSSHLILFRSLLLLPPIPPSIRNFPMSQLFAWGGQSTGVSALASFLPKNTQGWSPL